MSHALNGSTALQRFEHGNAFKNTQRNNLPGTATHVCDVQFLRALFPGLFEKSCNETRELIATSFKNEKNGYTHKKSTT